MANMTDKEAKERGKEVQDAINDLINAGKLPEIKSMTRAQRRELDAKKLNYFKGVSSGESAVLQQENCSDWILDNVYPDFDFDNLPNNICYYFGQMVFAATYSDKLSEKN